jgi:hypothetical protein
MKTLTKLLLGLVATFICFGQPAAWAQKSGDKILFLHLKIKDGAMTLVQASSRPGTLKTPPREHGDIQVEMVSTEGEALWSTLIEDPLLQRYEYEDPDHPGQLKRIERRLQETEFMLRVPFHSKGKQVILSRKPVAGGPAAQAPKQIMGTFDISSVKEGR